MTRFLPLFFLVLAGATLCAAEKPNFLWIMSEDNSKHYLKLFDPAGAPAPNIEALAEHGLVYEHAFSNAPVCSVARTTLITACYAPRIGTQFHRRSKLVPMPEGVRMFPAYLRDAGYYTTNNRKEDYNAVKGPDVWDASSKNAAWQNRPEGAPFFHVQSFSNSHESSLHFNQKTFENEATDTDLASVTLADYHPDTPLYRYTYARYHDRMGQIDAIVGNMVAQLEQAGVLEDTFIFYFGDHGGVLPRSKGYVQESGLHIPLVVRVPKNWQHLVDAELGSRVRGFVSFIDFGPTVLNLAGAQVPDQVDGKPFLGPGVTQAEVNQRQTTFGYADRFDEKYDLCRSLRKGKFKYIRNYQPFYPDALQNNYRYRMLAYEEWRSLYRVGQLNSAQRQFFEPKAVEALYDLEADPHEVNNLAGDPAYAETLLELRRELRAWVKGMPDLSFYPESVLFEEAFENPVAFGQSHQEAIGRLVDIADSSLQANPELEAALKSGNAWERYWALIACSSLEDAARAQVPLAKTLLDDPEPLVGTRAAEFLGILGVEDPRPTLVDALNSSTSEWEALLIFNSVVFLNDRDPGGYPFDLTALDLKVNTKKEVGRRIEYLQAVSQ